MPFPEDLEFCRILEALIPHLPKAKVAIQTLVRELKRGSVINWCNIRTVIGQLYRRNFIGVPRERMMNHSAYNYSFPSRTKFENFIFKVLTLLGIHECLDKSVIADILEVLCFTKYVDVSMDVYKNRIDTRLNKINGQTSMSAFEKLLVVSYKDMPSEILKFEFVEPYKNWVETMAVNGETDLLIAMISYGVIPIVPARGMRIEYLIIQLFICEGNFILEIWGRFFPRLRHSFLNLDGHSRKRVYLISVVMEMFGKRDFHARTDEHIRCARIFINSTPEPLITSGEMKRLLLKMCSGIVPNDKILPFLKQYESHFPESCEASTPRSLKHLSRFQVRECLRTARSFPNGVKSLRVPKKIQDYICFKDMSNEPK